MSVKELLQWNCTPQVISAKDSLEAVMKRKYHDLQKSLPDASERKHFMA